MYHTIVMTSGTSLFSLNNYFGNWTRSNGFFRFQGLNPLLHSEEEAKAIQSWLSAAHPLIVKREWDPESVSAEYSMLYALKKLNKLTDRPSVYLFHTETLGGVAAAKLLHRIITQDFSAAVQLIPVPINVADRVALNRSLGEYMYRLSETLIQGHPSGTCFAPIGGYKVMTSLGYIVGSFYSYPTAYLNEDVQQMLHIIPPVPINIDESFFRDNLSFIRRLYNAEKEQLDFSSLSRAEQELVEGNPALFTREENYVRLNPFGHFLFSREQFRSRLQTKFYISEAVQQTLNHHPSHRQFVYRQIFTLSKYVKSSQVEKRGELFHERDFQALREKRLSYHLYKGASNGGLFRAAWRYDAAKDELYINYLWLSKPYEQDVIAGKGLLTDEGMFHEVTQSVYAVI